MSVTGAQFWTQVFLKVSGLPYAGARVFTYAAGTLTPKTVWTDEGKGTPAVNPVVGDGSGRVSFYGDGDYRLIVRSSIPDGDLLLYPNGQNTDWDNIKIVGKAGTLRAENQGLSYPPAVGANRGQFFALTDGGANVLEVGVQKDTAFKKLQFADDSATGTVSWSKGADIASASTLTLGNDGNFWDVSGTTTISAISSKPTGTIISLRTLASLTIQYNVVSLILQDAINVLTNIGDVLTFVSLGGGNWMEINRRAPAAGSWSVCGCDCSVPTTTTFQLKATVVTLRNSSDRTYTKFNPSNITVDVSVTGPAINARDQAGAFSSSSWVHFYWIWNGSTLAGIASAFAPPTGPVFPTGYTHWGYAGAVRYNATPILVPTRIKGSRAWTDASQVALASGAAGSETAIGLSGFVPPNASEFHGYLRLLSSGITGNGRDIVDLRSVTGGSNNTRQLAHNANTTIQEEQYLTLTMPNVAQQIFYLITKNSTGGTTVIDLVVTGYTIPNGGE